VCTPAWTCGAWAACSNGLQNRTCTDSVCGSPDRTESSTCSDTATEVTVDNRDEGFTTAGVWKVSTASGFYGQDSLNSFTAGDTATWNTTALMPNTAYDVYFHWTQHENRAKNVRYEIFDGTTRLEQKTIDQSIAGSGGQWSWQGAYTFTASTGKVVMIAGTSGNSSNADAVRFTPKPKPLVAFQRGDVDGNGELLINDAMFTLWFLFAGGSAPLCMDAADADDDGTVNISDAKLLLEYMFTGKVIEIPEPFNACGVDPTPQDNLGCANFLLCQ